MLSDGMFYMAGVTMLVYNDPDPVLQKFQNENLSLVDIATSSGKVCKPTVPTQEIGNCASRCTLVGLWRRTWIVKTKAW
jgi:hypothetical protein